MTDAMATAHTDSTPTTGSPSDRPFQFTLRQAVIGMGIISFLCALVFQWGWVGVILCVALAAIFALLLGALRGECVWTVGGFLLIGLDVFVVVPFAMYEEPLPYRVGACRNNLKAIVIGLHNYHDTYGTLPPAYITDATGKPIHSWRIMILPFIEEKPLYDRYRFDEPWDGPNNIQLLSEMPSIYGCPASSTNRSLGIANYLAVVGPHAAWQGETPRSLDQFADGTSGTLLVVESHGSGICWLQPTDLDADLMPKQINPPASAGISSPHTHPGRSSVHVAFADGSVRWLDGNSTPQQLQALLTIDGGEKVKLPRSHP
jgi:prepilin-type processing-associated H-X9-DG protein